MGRSKNARVFSWLRKGPTTQEAGWPLEKDAAQQGFEPGWRGPEQKEALQH